MFLCLSVHKHWHGNQFDWIWLGETDTNLNVTSLLDYLSAFDKKMHYFIGRALKDNGFCFEFYNFFFFL